MPYINGFSVSSSPSRIGVKSLYVPGTQIILPVRNEIAPLLLGAAREFHRTVESLVRGWCWGYNFRPVTGGGSYSFHAAGIAIDLNAPRHPYGKRNTFSAPDRARCRAIAKKYGLRWGGDYSRTADDMHFEVIVSRPIALEMVRRLQTPTSGSPVPSVPPAKSLPVDGNFGFSTIRALQVILKVNADGQWGPTSKRALQRRLGVPVDGDIGPVTIKALQRWVGATQDGKWGPGTTRAIQTAINSGRIR